MTADQELARCQAALQLVWSIHVRRHAHLGLERPSGVDQQCIPCICAAALRRGMFSDDVTTEDFLRVQRIVEDEKHE